MVRVSMVGMMQMMVAASGCRKSAQVAHRRHRAGQRRIHQKGRIRATGHATGRDDRIRYISLIRTTDRQTPMARWLLLGNRRARHRYAQLSQLVRFQLIQCQKLTFLVRHLQHTIVQTKMQLQL
uniref:Uncharacterized protein n=1 Tax=Anopheles culicifacies TaxID=139723 RepID=A0A182LY33_9DIPT